MLDTVQTLLLYGPVESFDMSLVVLLANSGVAMLDTSHFQSMREAGGELTAVIRLNHFEFERGFLLCATDKPGALFGTNLFNNLGIGPPAEEVDEGVHIDASSIWSDDVDGINLQKSPTIRCQWAFRMVMGSLPWTAFLSEVAAVERSLD